MRERTAKHLAFGASALAAAFIAAGLVVGGDVAEGGWLLPIAPAFVAVGALLASRRPANPIGWLFLGFGVIASIDFAAWQYAAQSLIDDPGSLPGGNVAAAIAAHIWHPAFGLFVFSFLLFPDGHLLSPRWRWVARVVVVTYAGLAISGPFDTGFISEELPEAEPLVHGTLGDIGTAVFGGLLAFNLLLLGVSGASLILRLKRARGEQRQQVKWFVYAVAFVMFTFPLTVLFLGSAGIVLFPLIPASAAVAILKYRLYDIDVVVNRTLVYGGLTATLAGAYLGSVLLLQLVLSPSSDLAIAGSTLAVAGLFRPLRHRIQELVDRRFYRRRYDAARTLEYFGVRLRDEIDLDSLGGELRGVVAETMQPAHVSLWLRESAR